MKTGVQLKSGGGRFRKILLFASGTILIILLANQALGHSLQPKPAKVAQTTSASTLEPPPKPTTTSTQDPAQAVAPTTKTPQAKAKPKPSPSTKTTAPTSEIAPASACPNQGTLGQYQSVIACMTNYARKYHGLGTVSINSILNASADAKADDIISCGQFSHTACGRASNYWIENKGYGGDCSAENIAQGQKTPGAVFKAWMNSSGHRANILRASYVHLGVAQAPGGTYSPTWVMHLGGC